MNHRIMNQPRLGKKILELRKSKGYTQKELAENGNISLRTVQRIEAGEVTPRNHTVKVLFSVLEYKANENLKESFFNNKWLQIFFNLFNLKSNTMKKLSVLSFLFITVTTAFFLKSNKLNAQKIEGWHISGSEPQNYLTGLDKKIFKTAESSAFLASKNKKKKGFGTLMQTSDASNYIGKRIKMTAYIKSENIKGWSGMWLRIDSKIDDEVLGFDNMGNRPIKGTTEWKQYEIVLDVPEESSTLNYGILLSETGKVWFDNIRFTVVDTSVNITKRNDIKKEPSNLNFND